MVPIEEPALVYTPIENIYNAESLLENTIEAMTYMESCVEVDITPIYYPKWESKRTVDGFKPSTQLGSDS